MREIKFRGKPTENNTSYIEEEFVYGSLVIDSSKYYIVLSVNDNIKRDDYEVYMIEVIPETLGQYTGLKDKNGKEIYEGDIIFDSFYEKKAKVVFLEGAFWLDYIDDFKEYETIHKRYQLIANYDNKSVLEVIGNIYDNPELLEEGE